MNMFQSPTLAVTQKTQFVVGARAVCTDKIRALWMPDSATTGSTVPDLAVPTRTWTYDSTPAGGRYTAQGNGVSLSFNGTTQYLTCPDADDLSFGNGSVDTPFSVFAVGNITNTASSRMIVGKISTGTLREWGFFVLSTDVLRLFTFDDSAAVSPVIDSTASATQGSMTSFAGVYDASTGGATAANNMALYEGGVVKAATVTNNASYVAMENLGGAVGIGAQLDGAIPFSGSLCCVIVVAAALTSVQIAQLHALAKRYFGI